MLVAAMWLFHATLATEAMAEPEKKNYFDENTTPNVIALLPMPPAVGTEEENADRESALKVYLARTPAQFELAKKQGRFSVFHFSRSIGPWFQKGKLPRTEALFAQLDRETAALVSSAKKYYQRPRPAQIDSATYTQVISKDSNSGSYPSGHSMRGTLYGLLLAEIFPNARDTIHAQGREIGWLRVQGGMDTPLDVYAGRVFGRACAFSLMRHPDFLSDFEAVRKELAAAAAAAETPAQNAPAEIPAK